MTRPLEGRTVALAEGRQLEELARMFEAGPNGRQAGLEMAQELLLHAHTLYAGVYLMPSFGRYELCASVLDVLPRFAMRET